MEALYNYSVHCGTGRQTLESPSLEPLRSNDVIFKENKNPLRRSKACAQF